MPTLTYVGNKNAGDGNAALNVASGMVRLGASGVFTAAEQAEYGSLYYLVSAAAVGVSVVNGPPTVETITIYPWPGDNFYLAFGGQTTYALPTSSMPSDVAVALNALTSIGVNDVQTITTTGTPTGGSFTLTFGGFTTTAIPYNATAAQVQSALQALPSIGGVALPQGYSGTNVACTGGALPTGVACTFQGALAGALQTAMTFTNSLTGGSTPTPVVTHTTSGATNCTLTGGQGGPYVVTFSGTLAGSVQAAISGWGTGFSSLPDLSKFPYQTHYQ
jgi:hypothetical protein